MRWYQPILGVLIKTCKTLDKRQEARGIIEFGYVSRHTNQEPSRRGRAAELSTSIPENEDGKFNELKGSSKLV
jgi:hypothetical protein